MDTLYRTLAIDWTRADPESRTVPAVLSTGSAVERYGFTERIEFGEGSVIEHTVPTPLLLGHNHKSQPIGAVENIHVVGGVLRALVRFGTSRLATEAWESAIAGIGKFLSIGYSVLQSTTNKATKTLTVTQLRLLEASLVAIPADPGAALFRTMNMDNETDTRSTRRASAHAVEDERLRIGSITRKVEYARSCQGSTPQFAARAEAYGSQLIEDGGDPDVMQDWLRANQPRPEPMAATVRLNHGGPERLPRIMDPVVSRAFGDSPAEASRNAFTAGQWIRGALLGNQTAQQWLRDYSSVRSVGHTQSGGGSLVPEELSNSIINLRNEFGIARKYCSVFNMASDSLLVPKKASSHTAYFVAEGATITDSAATFSNIGLSARKLAVLVKYSSEINEDSVIDLAAFLSNETARLFAEKEDDCLFNGTGSSTYGGISGLITALPITAAGAVVAVTANHDVLTEIDLDDIAAAVAKLPLYARKNAKFYCSPACYDLVFCTLMASSGGADMVTQGNYRPAYFWGHEIVQTTSINQTATTDLTGLPVFYFGDLSMGAILGSRRDLDVMIDPSRFMEQDLIAFRCTSRVDINCHSLNDTSTPGPVVMLYGGAS